MSSCPGCRTDFRCVLGVQLSWLPGLTHGKCGKNFHPRIVPSTRAFMLRGFRRLGEGEKQVVLGLLALLFHREMILVAQHRHGRRLYDGRHSLLQLLLHSLAMPMLPSQRTCALLAESSEVLTAELCHYPGTEGLFHLLVELRNLALHDLSKLPHLLGSGRLEKLNQVLQSVRACNGGFLRDHIQGRHGQGVVLLALGGHRCILSWPPSLALESSSGRDALGVCQTIAINVVQPGDAIANFRSCFVVHHLSQILLFFSSRESEG
mmetsp:Transcript_29849/g.76668  ORF Transcript_29849/g.76668 Transcript_29849/m.76668 type:complete len:264 (+) Transcript_29849:97-888(+)